MRALAVLALGLAGCGTVAPPPSTPVAAPTPVTPAQQEPTPAPAPPAPPPPSAEPAASAAAVATDGMTQRLLAAHERLRELSTADLAREIVRLGAINDPPARIELAIALAQTRSNGDLARALSLLEPLIRPAAALVDAASPSPPQVAAAPGAPWTPFARLLHARLSEQRRLEEQIDRQAQQLREQQRRLEQLGAQIDALRAIERSLNTRPAAPAAPGAAPR